MPTKVHESPEWKERASKPQVDPATSEPPPRELAQGVKMVMVMKPVVVALQDRLDPRPRKIVLGN